MEISRKTVNWNAPPPINQREPKIDAISVHPLKDYRPVFTELMHPYTFFFKRQKDSSRARGLRARENELFLRARGGVRCVGKSWYQILRPRSKWAHSQASANGVSASGMGRQDPHEHQGGASLAPAPPELLLLSSLPRSWSVFMLFVAGYRLFPPPRMQKKIVPSTLPAEKTPFAPKEMRKKCAFCAPFQIL